MSKHWNYRVLAKKVAGSVSDIETGELNDVQFAIYEVHYTNDIPHSCTVNEMKPISFESDIEDPIESLKWQLDAMRLACEKPVLDYEDFPNEYVKHLRKKKLYQIAKLIK